MVNAKWGRQRTSKRYVLGGEIKGKDNTVTLSVEGREDSFGHMRWRFTCHMDGGLNCKSLWVYPDAEEAQCDAVTMANNMLELGIPS